MNANGPICSTNQISGESTSSTYNNYFATSGDTIRIRTPRTPASSADDGLIGEWIWDEDYLYVCTSNNNWKRVALSTF